MAPMSERALHRYELRRVLGRGGTGIVYEAYDPRTQAVVALKTIASPVAENLYRLKQEFRALSDVQHRNLVRFGELSSHDGQWYFTMELVRGTSFLEYVRPGGDGAQPLGDGIASGVRRTARPREAPTDDVQPGSGTSAFPGAARALDEARLRAALPQIVSALSAIHDAGHVHRDVKPSNVLVSGDGRLVLLDFGLVTALKNTGRADSAMLGTPAFMAPEQIEGVDIGPAADWYATGVMLFLALTGRLPFTGSNEDILEAKLINDAPAPSSVATGVPADLDVLCAALLRTDPSERATADDIRRALGMKHEALGSGQMRAADPTAVFVGREREVQRLDAVFADVLAGRGRLAIVEGEPGVGKSAVATRFLDAAGARATVLSGRCYEQETVPFKGIDSILDALSEHLLQLADDEVAALLEGGVRYLAAVFPVLNRVPAVAAATAGSRGVDNAAALREQAFGELERLVRALAERRPLVLFLDDLQWADRDSLAILERILSGASQSRCLFLATMRSGVELSREAVALAARGERIVLAGLSAKESEALWDALWPTQSRSSAAAAREAVMREAAGHPLFLSELVRSARAGQLGRHTGAALQDVLWERVCERDEVDRRLLEMAAVAGAPTPLDVLARAAGADLGESVTRLGALRAAQLVRVSRRGEERLVEPYHDRVRESIVLHVEREGAAAMRDRRLRLGRALLDGASREALAHRVFAIVQHFNAARDGVVDPAERARLVELNLLAARQARLATAYDKAAGYARVALELLGERAWQDAYALARDLHVERMHAEYLAGNDDAALACFEAARPRLATVEDRTDLHVAWIGLQTGRGKTVEALAAGRAALAEIGAKLPARGSLLGVLVQYTRNRLSQRSRRADELLHLPRITDAQHESVQKLLISLAPPAFFCDTNLLTWILLRTADLSMRYGVSSVSSYGFAGYGLALSGAFGKHEEGGSFGRLSLALHERFQSHALGAKLHLLNGFLGSWIGPFEGAKTLLRDGQQIALQLGDTNYECYAATVLSVVNFCESADLASVQEIAAWAQEISVRRMDRDMAGVPDAHARHAATLRGLTPSVRDLGTATSTDADFRASLGDAATPTALFYYYFCNAELRYAFGDADAAHALLAQAKTRTQGIFALPTTLELVFLDALVMARRHDRAGPFARIALRARVAQAVKKLWAWARSSPTNFEAHARIAEAELARIRGRRARATDLFERAITAARAHKTAKREAIALELSAAHARACGDAPTAERQVREAIEAYRRWGATAKADDLERRGAAVITVRTNATVRPAK